VDKIGDLKKEEINEVYYLESKNIYKVINSTALWLGIYGDEQRNNVMRLPEIQELIYHVNNESDDLQNREAAKFYLSIRCLLALTPNGHNVQFKPVFDGKIPKKMFAFRQDSAEEWFDNYTNLVLRIAAKILVKMDAESAWTYICCNTAWYLNKSQTFKYYAKSTDKNMNETIGRILKEFITFVGGNDACLKNNNLAPLYKDL
jgi:hypothetical protein